MPPASFFLMIALAIWGICASIQGFPGNSGCKESTCNAGDPWEDSLGKRMTTNSSTLHGEFHGQRRAFIQILEIFTISVKNYIGIFIAIILIL